MTIQCTAINSSTILGLLRFLTEPNQLAPKKIFFKKTTFYCLLPFPPTTPFSPVLSGIYHVLPMLRFLISFRAGAALPADARSWMGMSIWVLQRGYEFVKNVLIPSNVPLKVIVI